MQEKKEEHNRPLEYSCNECGITFKTLKDYISHIDEHQKRLVQVPEKKSLKDKAFSLFSRDKPQQKIQEVEPMAKVDESNTSPAVEERFAQNERAMSQMMDMLLQIQDSVKKRAEPELEQSFAPVQQQSGFDDFKNDRKIRFTVLVSESISGEFLKVIQENQEYRLEDLEFVKPAQEAPQKGGRFR